MSVRPFTSPILALVGVIAGGIPAAAQAVEGRSAGNLVQACKAEQGDASGWCSAYLLGVADTLTAFGEGGERGGCAALPTRSRTCPRCF